MNVTVTSLPFSKEIAVISKSPEEVPVGLVRDPVVVLMPIFLSKLLWMGVCESTERWQKTLKKVKMNLINVGRINIE